MKPTSLSISARASISSSKKDVVLRGAMTLPLKLVIENDQQTGKKIVWEVLPALCQMLL